MVRLRSLVFLLLVGGRLHAVPSIEAPEKVPAYTLARCKAKDVPPKAAVLWRVFPADNVSKAAGPKEALEFVAPPGKYRVELVVIVSGKDGLTVDEAAAIVTILPPGPGPGPAPPSPGGTLNAPAALCKLRVGNSGCTATVIGPQRPDGRWDVLTAAHCIGGGGAGTAGTITLQDGRTFSVKVVAINRTIDCAWLLTTEQASSMSYAVLAAANPSPGVTVWHAGYGVDRPGNKEEGTVAAAENRGGQLQFRLSVSSGDSGGGIFRTDTNELVSNVCCTTGMGRTVAMWGVSVEQAAKLRPPHDRLSPDPIDSNDGGPPPFPPGSTRPIIYYP